MRKNLCFLPIFLIVLASCGLSKGNKKVTEIYFDYDEDSRINYGYSFNCHLYGKLSNGKTRKLSNKSETSIEISGATYSGGSVSIDGYPTDFGSDLIDIRAVYASKTDTFMTEISIPFNYNGRLKLDFSGENGDDGSDGGNGGTSMIFRHGKDGDAGDAGENGYNGSNVTVYAWKESGSELYKIQVYNMDTEENYYYNYMNLGHGILIDVSGGNAGNGGNGGNGGDGKDGMKTEKKTKDAGDGGNGGNGGDGGTGGDGGAIYLYLHTNAEELNGAFSYYYNAGNSGAAGKPGTAGKGGTPLAGQNATNPGAEGFPGNDGFFGNQGPEPWISIEPFDF